MQIAQEIAKFVKAGNMVRVMEVEILSASGFTVEGYRYAVQIKLAGQPLLDRQTYEGVQAREKALDNFEFRKSLIDLNT
jgi:hypothetical protein